MILLEVPGARGADGASPPCHEVERDFPTPRNADRLLKVTRGPQPSIAKLEAGPDIFSITRSSEARTCPSGVPVEDRITATEFFLQRARKRAENDRQEVEKALAALFVAEAKLHQENASIAQAEDRLRALQEAQEFATDSTMHNSTDVTRSRRRCGWCSFDAVGSGRFGDPRAE